MSWSISKSIGKAAPVRAQVAKDFEQAAENYQGQTEAEDVLGARDAVLSWIDESDCSENEVVEVCASGSRGQGWIDIEIHCRKISLTT